MKGVNDIQGFNMTRVIRICLNKLTHVKHAMSTVGISEDEQFQIVSIVAAVLHLGNVQVEGRENSVIPSSQRPRTPFY